MPLVPDSRRAVTTPESLAWLGTFREGQSWLKDLPSRLAACKERWGLEVGMPFENSFESLVLPVRTSDHEEAVLKLQFPNHENRYEAQALSKWADNGAVRLLDLDDGINALLIERCIPGTPISAEDPISALPVMAELLDRLAVPAGSPFARLEDEARHWLRAIQDAWRAASAPFEEDLLDHVVELLQWLPGSQGQLVLVHQDLHADNVLRAEREPWLVIDPKPLLAEREFALAPVVRSHELGHSQPQVLHRLGFLARELGLERDRARAWATVQAVAWCFDGNRVLPRHLEVARWLRAAA